MRTGLVVFQKKKNTLWAMVLSPMLIARWWRRSSFAVIGELLALGAIYKVVSYLYRMSRSKHSLKRAPKSPKSFGDGDVAKRLHEDEGFVNAQGMRIATQFWLPETKSTTLALIVHGFGEHSGRYAGLGRALAEEGLTVAALDHQGFGRSEGDRAHIEKFDHYIGDVLQFLEICQAKFQPKKVIVLGHSMGGLIATATVLKEPSKFSGLILSAPAIDVPPEKKSGVAVLASGILSKLLPKLQVAFLPITGISRDRQVLHKFLNDPLVYKGGMRARWVSEALKTMDFIFASTHLLTFPLIILHGDHDTLVPLAASKRLIDNAATDDKTLHVLPDAFHEVLNEQYTYCLDILQSWLRTRSFL